MKLKFCHSARLEVCYCLVSFFAEVKIFNFWIKTMDYSPWFDFWESGKSFEKSMALCSKRKENLIALVSAAQHLRVWSY